MPNTLYEIANPPIIEFPRSIDKDEISKFLRFLQRRINESEIIYHGKISGLISREETKEEGYSYCARIFARRGSATFEFSPELNGLLFLGDSNPLLRELVKQESALYFVVAASTSET